MVEKCRLTVCRCRLISYEGKLVFCEWREVNSLYEETSGLIKIINGSEDVL